MRTDLLAGWEANIRELKQLQRRPQRQKTNGFMIKTTALHVITLFSTFLKLPSTAPLRETSQCYVLWRTWTYEDKFYFLYLNMDKVHKNSTPGKVAYI